ncbi:hypothetical protein OG894_01905 [Streptomyces sp. NBC_01724]|uniref:hypothetical protein n=1 Tax=unclassified Streptomyces TaxID=2593676 RepID=UPI002E2F75FC|nr:hypothetical protein [Streptomyces sp. NBC_01724]WTE64542.1 hypothetical protein OG784_40500 [Streptomyces sp. NBC_01617]WTI91827.1 hypothetical protein OHB17_39810 [Streptomyces sp. NBC_00724]
MGDVDAGDACRGWVLRVLLVSRTDCMFLAVLKRGGALCALTDEAVQARFELGLPVEVVEFLAFAQAYQFRQ